MAEAQNTQNAYAAVQARIPNPAMLLPGVTEPVLAVLKAVRKAGVPQATLDLVHLRASQINGCSYCVHGGTLQARKAGERDERLHTVAAWADAPFFTSAERAALALTEAVTRLSDRTDPVPDAVWNEAAAHYGERQLAALVLMIGMTNFFNRVNVSTRQVAGSAW
ncbi:carboxymuconolactone decarboxylase family protein [Streptomyces sp. NPDC039022]|uniref:carboxymuconolactone decarboxylase family protein n=1 Tax=Streptomyces sp. NPDC039022 TaxID=3157091 RepID=UPI0033FDA0FF